MKKRETTRGFDHKIGSKRRKELTKREHDAVRAHRRQLYGERNPSEKLEIALIGFRFAVERYVEESSPAEITPLGSFIVSLLDQAQIKRGKFAECISVSPNNINKYFRGERKFNMDQVLRMEHLFEVDAHTLLEIQLKNELIQAKSTHKKHYDQLSLEDLISD